MSFRAVSFDCYGTLVDWETGILDVAGGLLAARGARPAPAAILESFARHEADLESQTPILAYRDVLRGVLLAMGKDLGAEFDEVDADGFADSIGRWPLFGDVLPALRRIHGKVTTAILSNVDRRSFARTKPAFEGLIDEPCLAEEVGAYKPSARAFEGLLTRLGERGIQRHEVLHVAQSLFHDHEPAAKLGIASCWLDRRHDKAGWGAVLPPVGAVTPPHRITSMAELPGLLGVGG